VRFGSVDANACHGLCGATYEKRPERIVTNMEDATVALAYENARTARALLIQGGAYERGGGNRLSQHKTVLFAR
jgi:hypothetical protein